MMTVMVMSINRLVGEGGEFPWLGRKQHCCARLDGPLLWHRVTLGADHLLFPFFFFSVFVYVDSLLSQSFSEPFTGDSLSDSASLHHAHTPTSAPPLGISAFCLSSVYLRTLLHLHLFPLNLSHFSLILVLLPHGVIAQSPASIFMTIIEARMLMPLDFSLPVSQQQHQAEEGR